ncbi:MAG: hypothetical protein KDD00_17450, partial [Ignavibacteriae bacterium]|nr:hypothetical protein [Ignavibacteriota bacterium]
IDNGELDWAENFVNDHIKEMHSEYQENMKFYSMAIIHFEKGEFEKSLENITKVKYDFFLFKMDVKITMFKIYFELELYDQAYSIIDTLKHYISNSRDLSDIMKHRGSNFAKYGTKLLNEKTRDHDADPGLLIEMISSEKHLGSKSWFLKKLSPE